MSIFKSAQQRLDAAYLRAVSKYKFTKARRLVEKGANPCAVDKDGNNAFHVLAKVKKFLQGEGYMRVWYGVEDFEYNDTFTSRVVEEFIHFLRAKDVDINALNCDGDSCLHLIVNRTAYKYAAEELTGLLCNCGANPNILDASERAPLHRVTNAKVAERLLGGGAELRARNPDGLTPLDLAAIAGNEDLCLLYVRHDESLLLIGSEPDGTLPHQRVAHSGRNYTLADALKKKYELEVLKLQKTTSEEKEINKAQDTPPPEQKIEEKAKPEVLPENASWALLAKDRIGYVSTDVAIGYKMTQIFNFHADHRNCTIITQNLKTNFEGQPIIKEFDEFADTAPLRAAYDQLIAAGGKADENVIQRKAFLGASFIRDIGKPRQ